MSYKKFGISFIIIFIILLIGTISFVFIIDPYFHYHKPLKSLKYQLLRKYQRYQNYGIVRHFDYDSIIIGSSMTENFKTSEFDKLFQVNSIKVPLRGGYHKEVGDLQDVALKNNKNIKYVIRSLDYFFYYDKDAYKYDYNSYPNYLYNDSIFDDVEYVLNKEVILYSLGTLNNKEATTFDKYSYWSHKSKYGKEALDASYERVRKRKEVELTNSDIEILEDNVNQNVIELVKKYPDIQFYFFYPPYSIYYFDDCNQKGMLQKMLYGEKKITEMLLEYDNVHIFSFLDMYDIITNLDNYIDHMHYSADINSMILQSMSSGEHRLTKNNYQLYYDKVFQYYTNYDYDALFD